MRLPLIADVAKFMLQAVRDERWLTWRKAIDQIRKKFGDRFLLCVQEGSVDIDQAVLVAFWKLAKNEIVWSRYGLYWRLRKGSDDPASDEVNY